MISRRIAVFASGLAGVCLAVPVWAADPVQQHNSSAVWFENWIGLSNATMTVAAPNGKVTQIRAESGTPVFELDRADAQDGVYRYELRAATDVQKPIVNKINSGRGDAARDTTAVSHYETGFFIVERGAIITPPDITEEDAG